MAAAVSSIGTDAWLEKTNGTPRVGGGAGHGEVGVAVGQRQHADRARAARARAAGVPNSSTEGPAPHVAQHARDEALRSKAARLAP